MLLQERVVHVSLISLAWGLSSWQSSSGELLGWQKQPAVAWLVGGFKSHDGRRRQLDAASLTLREGQRCCVVGSNGCGSESIPKSESEITTQSRPCSLS